MSKPSDERSTPTDLYGRLDKKFGPFNLDVCATKENAKCKRFFTLAQDGLSLPWIGTVWLNCPYSRGQQRLWVRKAIDEVTNNPDCVSVNALLPADTSTKLFHRLILPFAAHIEFLEGRFTFGDADSPAKFPSMFVVFKRKGAGQLALFSEAA